MATLALNEYIEDPNAQQRKEWESIQEQLRNMIVLDDQVDFDTNSFEDLQYIGGVDLSFPGGDDMEHAVACLVVMKYPSLEVVYTDFLETRLYLPYIAGFLAFREVEPLQTLLNRLKTNQPSFYPQILLVDGNGRLHPRKCGIACHLGVVADIPTIGVGKNFLVIEDGPELQMQYVKEKTRQYLNKRGDRWLLKGSSGIIYGAAVRTVDTAPNPIYISQGHRISLDTAIRIILATSQYRIPEPIRRADQDSRTYIRTHKTIGND
ncbi:endonuclease V [Halteromyces radiatus]|uniref:endonuclease V n=1 Tax=Halteromyces radiatus TaxID=101107 RepID=UPI00221E5090|nr:endonuclease V [Halteromyces radiatus]KAI8088810.1 endonuclease V [Halteromyces radiatus]